VRAAQTGKLGRASGTNIWLVTMLCACAFMVIKYFEYTHKFHAGLLPGANFTRRTYFSARDPREASSSRIYFMMTGVHGIHVVIGIG
jgi:cytochrome c oxidase subunit 3